MAEDERAALEARLRKEMKDTMTAMRDKGATMEQLQKFQQKFEYRMTRELYQPGPVERFFEGGGRGLRNMLTGTAQLIEDVWNLRTPEGRKQAFQNYVVAPTAAMYQKSGEASQAGQPVRAGLYGTAAKYPVMGPMAAGYAERLIAPPEGNYAGAIGEMTAEMLPMLLGEVGRGWSKLPEAPPSVAPFFAESSTNPMAGLANLLAKTPFFKGRAVNMVKARNVAVEAEAQAIRNELYAPRAPIAREGVLPPRSTAIAETRGIPNITSRSPSELSGSVAKNLLERAESQKAFVGNQWANLTSRVGETPVDVTGFRNLAKQWAALPVDTQKFLATEISPQVLKLLERGGKGGAADISGWFGGGASAEDMANFLRLNPLEAAQGQTVPWQVVHEARKAIGARMAKAKGTGLIAESPDYGMLSKMYRELTNLLKKGLDESDLGTFEELSKATQSLHSTYGTGIADELISGRVQPSVLADHVLSQPVENIEAFMNAIENPLQKSVMRQALVNRMVESKTTLKGFFDQLLGKDAAKWKRVFPENYTYLVNELGHRLSADLFDGMIRGATRDNGIISGPKFAKAVLKHRDRFLRYGMNRQQLNRVEAFAKQLDKLVLSDTLKMGALGTQFHAYLQMSMAGTMISGAIGVLFGEPAAVPLGAAGWLIGERALVNMFLHPEGTNMLMRLLRTFKPGPGSAKLVEGLGGIMSGGALTKDMLDANPQELLQQGQTLTVPTPPEEP